MHSDPKHTAQFRSAYQQFAPIRQRFNRPGVERGGCPRANTTPVYVRRFGEHAATIFPGLGSVESSFDAEQLRMVTAATLALKHWFTGHAGGMPFGERVAAAYQQATRPFFVAALLGATEATLTAFLAAEPQHAPALDAIFCVAGSEGFRDLIRLYDARILQHVQAGSDTAFPDILAFVNIHERLGQPTERFEVWCPGYDLAKEYHQQCIRAAHSLLASQQVAFVPTLEEEAAMLPQDLVGHLSRFVRGEVARIAALHGA